MKNYCAIIYLSSFFIPVFTIAAKPYLVFINDHIQTQGFWTLKVTFSPRTHKMSHSDCKRVFVTHGFSAFSLTLALPLLSFCAFDSRSSNAQPQLWNRVNTGFVLPSWMRKKDEDPLRLKEIISLNVVGIEFIAPWLWMNNYS